MTTKATVYMAENAVVVVDDAKADILAIRQNGQIEVWSANGENHIGNLPEDADEAQIRAAALYWHKGFIAGVDYGRRQAKADMRKAIGI